VNTPHPPSQPPRLHRRYLYSRQGISFIPHLALRGLPTHPCNPMPHIPSSQTPR
jgi:hypothetical protein